MLIVFATLTLLQIEHPVQERTLTLEKAIKLALERNPAIHIQTRQVERADIEKKLGDGLRLPTLSSSASSSFRSSDGRLSQGAGHAEAWGNTFALDLSWALFTGYEHTSQKQIFELSHRLQSEVLVTEIENLIYQVSAAFFDIVKQKNMLGVSEENLEVSRERLQKARLRQELGQSSNTELLDAEVAFQNDEAVTAGRIETLENSYSTLKALLFLEPEEQLRVMGTIPVFEDLPDLGVLLTEIESRHPQLKQLDLNRQMAAEAAKIAKSGYYPRLSLNSGLSYNLNNNDFRGLSGDKHYRLGSVGLVMSYSLYDGHRRKVNLATAKINEIQVQTRYSQALNQLKLNVSNLYKQLKLQKKRLDLQVQTEQRTRQYLTLQKERFQMGTIDSLAFRDAQLRLSRASQALIAIKHQHALTYLNLMKSSGRLRAWNENQQLLK
ncbi:MAG: hypothetical protein CSA81_12425 [Acidobacteria bacterium]|nr:MAG: hypothetical protein CSA81_12425 [Acidobacteriota bacterium]